MVEDTGEDQTLLMHRVSYCMATAADTRASGSAKERYNPLGSRL